MKRAASLILLVASGLPVSAMACGWWGEALDETATEAVVVEGTSQKPDLTTPEGMARMARAYRIGDGVPHDDLVARRWAGLAAEAGHVGAMNDYGQMLEQGIGGSKDEVRAAAWYEKAAQAGDPKAAHSLAHMYFEGRGVKADKARGEDLLRQSAAGGHASAAEELAQMLWQGKLATHEPDEACQWWFVANLETPSGGDVVCKEHNPGLTETRLQELRLRAAAMGGGDQTKTKPGS